MSDAMGHARHLVGGAIRGSAHAIAHAHSQLVRMEPDRRVAKADVTMILADVKEVGPSGQDAQGLDLELQEELAERRDWEQFLSL